MSNSSYAQNCPALRLEMLLADIDLELETIYSRAGRVFNSETGKWEPYLEPGDARKAEELLTRKAAVCKRLGKSKG